MPVLNGRLNPPISALPERAVKEHSHTLAHGAVVWPEGDAAGRPIAGFRTPRSELRGRRLPRYAWSLQPGVDERPVGTLPHSRALESGSCLGLTRRTPA